MALAAVAKGTAGATTCNILSNRLRFNNSMVEAVFLLLSTINQQYFCRFGSCHAYFRMKRPVLFRISLQCPGRKVQNRNVPGPPDHREKGSASAPVPFASQASGASPVQAYAQRGLHAHRRGKSAQQVLSVSRVRSLLRDCRAAPSSEGTC